MSLASNQDAKIQSAICANEEVMMRQEKESLQT
jgi:hypothetical protein